MNVATQKKLTPRQQRFVREYLVDLNGTKAATRAGYKPKSANEMASQLLAKLNIQTAVAIGREKLTERTEITIDRIMEEFARIGFSDVRKLFTADGSLRPMSALSAAEAACISSIEVVTRTLPGADDDSPARVEYTHKIKLWDKVAALTQMGRRLGMYVDKHEVVGKFTLEMLVTQAIGVPPAIEGTATDEDP